MRPQSLRRRSSVPASSASHHAPFRLRGFAVVALVLAVSAATPLVAFALGNGKLQIHHVNVDQGDGILLISPLGQTALFDDGKARYFEHKDGGIAIRYFVIKSSDGVIRAAFDACDVCWRAGKGYAQDGDFMVCGNCGQRFKSTQVNEVKGGCNPAPLDRRLENGTVVIQVSDILGGKGYFDYSKKG